MKRFSFILVLSVILTDYLFSQVAENEIIKTDTATNIDFFVITKADTTVVEEPIDIPKEKDENYFYNHGLFSNRTDDGKTDDCKKTGIISAKIGTIIAAATISVAWDIPINCKTNFATKYFYSAYGGNMEGGGEFLSGYGLGVGYVSKRTNNVILRHNIYIALVNLHHKHFTLGINLGTDVILWKVFSVGVDAFVFKGHFYPIPTVGLNVVY